MGENRAFITGAETFLWFRETCLLLDMEEPISPKTKTAVIEAEVSLVVSGACFGPPVLLVALVQSVLSGQRNSTVPQVVSSQPHERRGRACPDRWGRNTSVHFTITLLLFCLMANIGAAFVKERNSRRDRETFMPVFGPYSIYPAPSSPRPEVLSNTF